MPIKQIIHYSSYLTLSSPLSLLFPLPVILCLSLSIFSSLSLSYQSHHLGENGWAITAGHGPHVPDVHQLQVLHPQAPRLHKVWHQPHFDFNLILSLTCTSKKIIIRQIMNFVLYSFGPKNVIIPSVFWGFVRVLIPQKSAYGGEKRRTPTRFLSHHIWFMVRIFLLKHCMI